MSEATQLEWKSYTDSTALNIAYTILFWKEKPGWVEVSTGSREKVLQRANDLTAAFWRSFHMKLGHGAAAIARSLRGYDQSRTLSLDSIRQRFANARAINSEVIELTRHAIHDLARIKLASDLVVKVSAPPIVSLPYSMAITFVKEMYVADSANVVVFEVSKEPAKEGAKQLAEKGSHLLAHEANGYKIALRNAEVDIARQNDLLRRRSATLKSFTKAAGRLEEATSRAVTAKQSAGLAVAGRASLRGVAWGFVALDVYEAWRDYSETVGI